MATGDDALAAGMDVVAGSVAANTIDTEITKTRDYIAQRTSAVTSVLKGGTGATTAAGARTALGVPATTDVVLDTDLAAGDAAVPWKVPTYNGTAQLTTAAPTLAGHAVDLGTLQGGFTTSGHIYLPGSTAASSGWTAAYINSDGRICRGASSLRYKKHVTEIAGSAFGNIFQPLNRFQMRGGDSRWTYGHIAEVLAENPDTERFVMYDAEGRPDSIDYVPLLLAKVEQLNARITALEAGT